MISAITAVPMPTIIRIISSIVGFRLVQPAIGERPRRWAKAGAACPTSSHRVGTGQKRDLNASISIRFPRSIWRLQAGRAQPLAHMRTGLALASLP
jgi:hypothetical protein